MSKHVSDQGINNVFKVNYEKRGAPLFEHNMKGQKPPKQQLTVLVADFITEEKGEEKSSDIQLPLGWDRCKDNYGRTYYYNDRTKYSCWRMPKVVHIQSRFRPLCKRAKLWVTNIQESKGARKNQQNTGKTFLVTLTSDRDSLTLFTAVYNQLLSDFKYEYEMNAREQNASAKRERQIPKPSLTICHKKAKSLNVDETEYAEFISTYFLSVSSNADIKDPFKKWIQKLKNKPNQANWFGQKPVPGSCPHIKLVRSKSKNKSNGFNLGEVEQTSSRISEQHPWALSNPREQKLALQPPVSLALQNSQNAQEYRKKKTQLVENAKRVKEARSSNFGVLKRQEYNIIKKSSTNNSDYEVAITPVVKEDSIDVDTDISSSTERMTLEGSNLEKLTLAEIDDDIPATMTLEETLEKIEKMRLEFVHASKQTEKQDQDIEEENAPPNAALELASYLVPAEPLENVVTFTPTDAEKETGMLQLMKDLENERMLHLEAQKLLGQSRDQVHRLQEDFEMARESRLELVKEISRVKKECRENMEEVESKNSLLLTQNKELKTLLSEFTSEFEDRYKTEEFVDDEVGYGGIEDAVGPENKYKAATDIGQLRLIRIRELTEQIQALESTNNELIQKNDRLCRKQTEEEYNRMPESVKLRLTELENKLEGLKSENCLLESQSRADKQALLETRKEYQDLLVRFNELEKTASEIEGSLQQSESQRRHLRQILEKERLNHQKMLRQSSDDLKAEWENKILNIQKEHAQTLNKLSRKHKLTVSSALQQVRSELEDKINTERSYKETLQKDIKILEAKQKAQQQQHKQRIQELKQEIENEKINSESALSESLIQREIEAIKIRRRCAITFLQVIKTKLNSLAIRKSFNTWNRYLSSIKTEEIVDVYGAAMDRITASCKISLVFNNIKNQNLAQSFKILKDKTITSQSTPCNDIDPVDLVQCIHNLAPSVEIDQIVDIVSSLRKTHKGKIENKEIYNVFGRGPVLSQQYFGGDFQVFAAMKLTRIDAILQKHQFIKLNRYWHKWRFTSIAMAQRNQSNSSEFFRNMERHALREEVKALHAQLAASKAEAWSFKRKLLSQFEWEQGKKF